MLSRSRAPQSMWLPVVLVCADLRRCGWNCVRNVGLSWGGMKERQGRRGKESLERAAFALLCFAFVAIDRSASPAPASIILTSKRDRDTTKNNTPVKRTATLHHAPPSPPRRAHSQPARRTQLRSIRRFDPLRHPRAPLLIFPVVSMWQWMSERWEEVKHASTAVTHAVTGGGEPSRQQQPDAQIRPAASASPPPVAAANVAIPNPTAATHAAPANLNSAPISPDAAAASSSAPRDESGLAPPSAPPSGSGFWGYTTSAVSVDCDPALDDMLQFFGFSHLSRSSDYSGAVAFYLRYDDGRVAIRTVQVLPRDASAGATIEEVSDAELEEEQKQQESDTPTATARVITYDSRPPDEAQVKPRLRGLLPPPVCSLILPRAKQPLDAADAITANDLPQPPPPPLPRLPFSPRIRLYSGPVPSDVRLTAELKCPRSIFFDVYLGRLDPIQAVVTRKAVCPGFRYGELYRFGKSFDLQPHKWEEFYAIQAEIDEAKRRRGQGGGTAAGGGGSGGTVTGAGGTGGLPTIASIQHHSSNRATIDSSDSSTRTSNSRHSSPEQAMQLDSSSLLSFAPLTLARQRLLSSFSASRSAPPVPASLRSVVSSMRQRFARLAADIHDRQTFQFHAAALSNSFD